LINFQSYSSHHFAHTSFLFLFFLRRLFFFQPCFRLLRSALKLKVALTFCKELKAFYVQFAKLF
jgi:hypothetical protein